ncbi:acyltransferase [Brumimicrobium salinarum]|uniref:Acyltransferase n=1 Tax=Brumimicrobium salinarum TaxID=2058658 RepID=A0A2I0R1Z2_9FLAO|nr:1-acyl-sn-glycerol-3-phosphate acyltransferase [Brumimicrobium salinarum]PKR80601.1 acyltransferase [Brumimicrobium salinarum]
MSKVAIWILKRMGWTIKDNPEGVDKAIIVMGPHTSNWDFIIGKLAFMHYGVKGRYLIKKELFFWPMGWFLKKLGGIPVDRKKNNNFTDQAVEYFENNESMYMVFTPEGTRSYSPNWKKGFYYIALKAKVPIYIGYMDYPTKTGGFLELFEPTGDIDKDIAFIKKELSQFRGKFPENGIRAVEDE